MLIFIAALDGERYIIVATSKEVAADAMRDYAGKHLSVTAVPENVKLPIVARVTSFAR